MYPLKVCVCVRVCVCVLAAQLCPTLCDPMDCSLPGSLSMGFSRQEYWSRLPCPLPGDLPNPGIETASLFFFFFFETEFPLLVDITSNKTLQCICFPLMKVIWLSGALNGSWNNRSVHHRLRTLTDVWPWRPWEPCGHGSWVIYLDLPPDCPCVVSGTLIPHSLNTILFFLHHLDICYTVLLEQMFAGFFFRLSSSFQSVAGSLLLEHQLCFMKPQKSPFGPLKRQLCHVEATHS